LTGISRLPAACKNGKLVNGLGSATGDVCTKRSRQLHEISSVFRKIITGTNAAKETGRILDPKKRKSISLCPKCEAMRGGYGRGYFENWKSGNQPAGEFSEAGVPLEMELLLS